MRGKQNRIFLTVLRIIMSYAEGDTDYGKDKEFMIPIEKAPFYGGAGNLGHGGNPSMVTLSGLVTDAEQTC